MKNKWQLTRVNLGHKMTRYVQGNDYISFRSLTMFEKIKYYFRIKRDKADMYGYNGKTKVK